MSTIEEAREQARDTLADYHRVNAGGYGAGNHASLARALRALLDATEPPAHDESCEADWGSEGQESPCRCAMPTDRATEDEREALANVLLDGRDADEGLSALRDRILAAGYRKEPRPITDEKRAEWERAAAEKAWGRCVGEMPLDLDWKNFYGDNNPYRSAAPEPQGEPGSVLPVPDTTNNESEGNDGT